MTESGDHQRARLAYEASLRALDQQRRVLEDIRSRAGILLAASSLSASFLGARAFDGHASVVLSGLALAALVVTLLLGVAVLAPREALVFSIAGGVLHADLLDTHDRAEQHRNVVDWLDAFWLRNEPTMRRLTGRFRIMAGALAIQIVLWTMALGATVG